MVNIIAPWMRPSGPRKQRKTKSKLATITRAVSRPKDS